MLLRNPSSSSVPCSSPSSSLETVSPQLSATRSLSQHYSFSPVSSSSTLGFVSPSLVPQVSSYSLASPLTTATSSAASPSDTPQTSFRQQQQQPRMASSTSSFFLQETRQGGTPSSTACRAYKLTYGGEEAGEKEGRVALVTGASRGIGKAIADALAEGGVSHLLCVARQQVRRKREEKRRERGRKKQEKREEEKMREKRIDREERKERDTQGEKKRI